MTKIAAIVYHRIDFDGICSYAIARRYLENNGYAVTPYPYNYGDEAPDIQELCSYDTVIIVDVCLPAEDMAALARAIKTDPTFDVIWCDHHKSSVEAAEAGGYMELPGNRHIGKPAACELTWEYLNTEETPYIVKILSAYDTWDKERLDWENETLPFQYGLRRRYALRAEEFYNDFGKLLEDSEASDVVNEGRIILDYIRQSGSKGVGLYGFTVTVGDGHKALCCLTNQFGALAFEEELRRLDIGIAVCVNRMRKDLYNVSMYGVEGKNTLDLSRYMRENYGGGGHFNAAGGRMDGKQFLRLMEDCEL